MLIGTRRRCRRPRGLRETCVCETCCIYVVSMRIQPLAEAVAIGSVNIRICNIPGQFPGWGDGVDTELTALCSAAATTLVTLMTTDSWDRVKAGFSGLWRRRPDQAKLIEADLEASRAVAGAAWPAGAEEDLAELVAEWRSRLRRIVAADEEAAKELRRLTEELRPLLADGPTGPVVMIAKASGSSRVNQAGRDQTVTG